jgi:hypothetical protein
VEFLTRLEIQETANSTLMRAKACTLAEAEREHIAELVEG